MIRRLTEVLDDYFKKEPEIVLQWTDKETDARGWLVINSLKGGAAGGGTRMRKGLGYKEVLALAKVMEIKFNVCGPGIGGAKSGINFDPEDPRRDEVLKRWFKAVYPMLKHCYGTGGDLNVDEFDDVQKITRTYGLDHPQEGVVNGHLKAVGKDKERILDQLHTGCDTPLGDSAYNPVAISDIKVSDVITGYGVAESVIAVYKQVLKEDIQGQRAIIQGWGNVAAATAFYLSKAGCRIVGIIDKYCGIINNDGLDTNAVAELIANRKSNKLESEQADPFTEINRDIWDVGADIFIPGAASRLVSRGQAERLVKNGCRVISCGANVPFQDDDIMMGETARWLDSQLTLIPDFIANCGMARTFHYLMRPHPKIRPDEVFLDVKRTVHKSIGEVFALTKEENHFAERAVLHYLSEITTVKKDI